MARREADNVISAALVAGVSGWLAHGMLDFGLHVPGVTLPAFLFLGLMTAYGTGVVACATERPRRAQRVVALLMVGLALFWAGRMLVANARATTGDWVGAVRLAPRNPQYWSDLGRASLRSGDADSAVVAFRQAARWDRYRAVYQWELAQALMVRDKGVTTEMVQALREAVRLYPGKASFRESLAGAEKILRQSGRDSGRVLPDQGGVTSQ
jgi:tetratricopeptide (TPR) repeat protein